MRDPIWKHVFIYFRWTYINVLIKLKLLAQHLWNISFWLLIHFLSYHGWFPYNLGSPYLIHTMIIEDTCQLGMCSMILTSFLWSTDFVKYKSRFRHDFRYVLLQRIFHRCCANNFNFINTLIYVHLKYMKTCFHIGSLHC
jgi:hypothetical protein